MRLAAVSARRAIAGLAAKNLLPVTRTRVHAYLVTTRSGAPRWSMQSS